MTSIQCFNKISSVQSLSHVSLWPRGLQHTRPLPTLKACSNSYPSSRWCHPTILSSILPFSSCLQSFPVSGSFPVSQFFASCGRGIGAPASNYVFSLVAQLCPTLCDPRDCSTSGFFVQHQLPELAQTHVHWICNPIQPSHPLLSPSSHAFNLSQHQGLFQ